MRDEYSRNEADRSLKNGELLNRVWSLDPEIERKHNINFVWIKNYKYGDGKNLEIIPYK